MSKATQVVLKAAQQFRQGRDATTGQLITYEPGDTIPDDIHQGWEPDTLANRLTNNFVEWKAVAAEVAEGDPDPAQMSRDGLLEYIEREYGAVLDKRISHANMLQQLAVIQERARVQQLADAEKAAAANNAGTTNTPAVDDVADAGTPPAAPAAPAAPGATSSGKGGSSPKP